MNDERLHHALRQRLDESAANCDPEIAARLRAGRERAVAALAKPARVRPRWIAGGLALAASVVLAVVLLPHHAATNVAPLDDYELLAADEQLDLYRDLDFYLWLEQEETAPPAG